MEELFVILGEGLIAPLG